MEVITQRGCLKKTSRDCIKDICPKMMHSLGINGGKQEATG